MPHLVREAGKTIPIEYLNWVSKKGEGQSFGFAVPTGDKTEVYIGHLKGGDTPENINIFQKHESAKGLKIAMSFNEAGDQEENQQPFVLLSNGDKKPQIVAFLDGDFSEFHEDASSHSDEFFCVQKELIPRIQKLAKFLGGNPRAIMEELKSPEYCRDWVNFMNGPSGSITLVSSDGTFLSFSVAGDTKQKAFDGWWTSDTKGYLPSSQKKESDVPAATGIAALTAGLAGKSRPKPNTGGTSNASTKSVEHPKKQEAAPVVPAPSDKPVAEPVPDSVPQVDGKPEEVPSPSGRDYSDPETVLVLRIPKHFKDIRSKLKFVRKRVPHSMLNEKEVPGMTAIELRRKYCNTAFLNSYAEQEGLSGLSALQMRGGTSVPPVTQKTDTAVPATAGQTKENGFPPTSSDAPVEPSTAPTPIPQVVSEPVPVLPPDSVAQLKNFIDKPETKLAVDKAGKLIADPKNIERVEKMVPSFSEQLGGKVDILTMARYPLETFLQIGAMNPNTLGHIAFWLAHELQKAFALMDELTDKKPEAPAVPSASQQTAQHEHAARKLRPKVRVG